MSNMVSPAKMCQDKESVLSSPSAKGTFDVTSEWAQAYIRPSKKIEDELQDLKVWQDYVDSLKKSNKCTGYC